jgi:hypothetical protein
VGKVYDLVVHSKLLAVVRDDEHTDGAGTAAKGLLETRPEVALINNLETLFDLTSLGHGNELTIITDVDETVLLEDGAEQAVEDHGGRRVGDNTRLLVELLGEEVNTEVTVLAGLGGGGDANDLARTVLKDDQITNTDVVARDGEGRGLSRVGGGDVAWSGRPVGDAVGLVGMAVGDGHVVEFLGGVVVSSVAASVGLFVVTVSEAVVLAHFVGVCGGDDRLRSGGRCGRSFEEERTGGVVLLGRVD